MIKRDLKLEIYENLNASVADVWEALTSKESVKKYFFGTEVNTDWKVGSPIIFSGNWEGQVYEDKGKILEIEKGKMFKYTHLSSFSRLADLPENYSTVTYQLKPENEETVLTIIQEGFKDEKALIDSQEGWKLVLNNLKRLLSDQ
jgi:uncharacterized protein YndB with AHSA1/START domain